MALLKNSDTRKGDYNNRLKILITGHTGFIGINLLKKLQSEFNVVTGSNNIEQRIDILEKNKLLCIEDVDTIVHLAAKTSIPNSISNPYDTYFTNIVGTLNILNYAAEKKVKNVINISTYIYGNPKRIPIDENHPNNPHTPYNKSKLISELLCKNYSEDYKINIVTLRPFYIYGPANNFSFIPSVLKKITKNEKVILSNKNTRRDFLFVDDFVNLIYKIIINFPYGYNVYNVGYGKSYSLENILKIIETIINKRIDIQYDNSIRSNDVVEMVADISKVKKMFKWKPMIDIEEGLRLTINNYPQLIEKV